MTHPPLFSFSDNDGPQSARCGFFKFSDSKDSNFLIVKLTLLFSFHVGLLVFFFVCTSCTIFIINIYYVNNKTIGLVGGLPIWISYTFWISWISIFRQTRPVMTDDPHTSSESSTSRPRHQAAAASGSFVDSKSSLILATQVQASTVAKVILSRSASSVDVIWMWTACSRQINACI